MSEDLPKIEMTTNITNATAVQTDKKELDPFIVQAFVDAGLLTIHRTNGRPQFDAVELALLRSRLR
jgi:hypothetical protein